ncbi:MAG TPA: ADOP family duplicated permease [Acidobacteriaceae bacterium]|nr:ADOP family duplicated permease [Acidobacteriaceae bacterium]
MQTLWQDIRFALRQLRKSPIFAATAILTLAIGIGANAAIFTLIDDAMLRTLPIPQPDHLVTVGFKSPKIQQLIPVQSLYGLDQLHRQLKSVEGLSGWSSDMLSVADQQGTLRSIVGDMVSGDALQMLGVRPYLGRLLIPADDVPGGPVGGWPAVLGYGFWQNNFHGDPAIIGRHIKVSGYVVTVVGVLPPNYTGVFLGTHERIMLPMHFLSALFPAKDLDVFQSPQKSEVMVLGRLRPDSTLRQLNAELASIPQDEVKILLPVQWRTIPDFRGATLHAESQGHGFAYIGKQNRQSLLLLQGIALLVLLLCCVNLTSVQFSRAQARQHEFAVRAALGASWRRIVQQSLIESLMLAAIGSVAAAALAWSSTRALSTFLTPPGSSEPFLLCPDPRVLAFTSALAILTTLLFGLAPAIFASRAAPAGLLRSAGTNRRRKGVGQRLCIPAQFAVALVLVFAAGLFSETLLHLRANHTGFDPSHITMVTAQFQALKKTPAEIASTFQQMTDTLRASPGIQSAAYAWVTPVGGYAPQIIAQSVGSSQGEHKISLNQVSEGYFSTMRTQLLLGREFTTADRDRSTCIVNQAAARLLFSGGPALGESIKSSFGGQAAFTAQCRVVGIAEDARYASLRDPAPPTLYFPAGESTVAGGGYYNNLSFLIRSHTTADATTAYRAALARYAPTTGYMSFLSLPDQIDQSLGSERLIALLSNTFAGIALLLSAVGLFGVLALDVEQRRPELGVRLALGATRTNLLRLVLSEAAIMVGAGALVGAVIAAGGSRLIGHFLYGVSTTNLGIALLALVALGMVALIAALGPALRASRTDPMEALRME